MISLIAAIGKNNELGKRGIPKQEKMARQQLKVKHWRLKLP